MTPTPLNDWSDPWLSALHYLKQYERLASLNDWDAAGVAASQVRALTLELEMLSKERQRSGQMETD